MKRSLVKFAKKLLRQTPYEIRRRLPAPTIDAVKLLLAFYVAGTSKKTLVQIGAADGDINDPVCRFVLTGRMRAVLIEPIDSMFRKLEQRYRDVPNVTLVRAAIAEEDGTAKMYRVRPDPKWDNDDIIPYLSSFDSRHIASFGISPNEIVETTVPAVSLDTLTKTYALDEIDLLQVDAEGYDAAIVQMALKLANPPKCINFERVNLSIRDMRDVFAALEARGYLLLHDAWNSLAIHPSVENGLSSG